MANTLKNPKHFSNHLIGVYRYNLLHIKLSRHLKHILFNVEISLKPFNLNGFW